jgi:hypothetical protein
MAKKGKSNKIKRRPVPAPTPVLPLSPEMPPTHNEPQKPKESHPIRISKAFGTFLLSAGFTAVIALIIGAFQLAGVISMGLAHMVMALALIVAAFSVWLWLLSRPQKRTMRAMWITALVLGVVFFGIDRFMVWKKVEQENGAVQLNPAPSVAPLPRTSASPNLQGADDSKRISSEMMDTVQKLIAEGKAIDTTNVRHANKAYTDWAERCSATMSEVDSRMKQMYSRETDYKTQCPSTQDIFEESKELLKLRIERAVLRLTRLQIKMPFDMLPDADVLRFPLSKD